MTIVIFLYKDGLPCYNSRIYGHRTTGKEYLMAKTADTIAIYSRKSRYTGKGESIGNQIDLCREYIRTHYGDAAAEHAVVFEDEGFSGGNLNRPDFKKMMTAAKDRKFKAIVVYRLDRISRNISDFSSLIEELGRLGLTPALCHPDHTMLFPAEKMPKRKKPPENLWAALLPCHILILPQTTFFYKQKTILNPLSPFILYRRTVLEVFRMLLTLLQFFASKFLVLALHLEAGSFPRPLSPQEEIRTFAALRAGDPSAREKLIRHNLRLVAHIAKKYYALPSEQDDLISIGTIGLMKAVDTFDSTRRARFSTYASRCIENELRMHFRRERKNAPTLSLQETLDAGKEDSALTLADVLQDGFCMEDSCEKQDDAQRLRRLIEGLPARERKLILLRYGLAGQPPLTQLETAKLLQISRSYVSRLETHALELLRAGWEQP